MSYHSGQWFYGSQAPQAPQHGHIVYQPPAQQGFQQQHHAPQQQPYGAPAQHVHALGESMANMNITNAPTGGPLRTPNPPRKPVAGQTQPPSGPGDGFASP